jgi:hypothetical protein
MPRYEFKIKIDAGSYIIDRDARFYEAGETPIEAMKKLTEKHKNIIAIVGQEMDKDWRAVGEPFRFLRLQGTKRFVKY